MENSDWRVLLLGGNSGSGKTYLAQALVRLLGIPALMVDDVRIALQQVTAAGSQPDLHAFLDYRPEQWLDSRAIVQDWLRVGKAMLDPLREIIAHHIIVEGSGRIILEGDGILPMLARQSTFDGIPGFENVDISQKVRAVFLIEEDLEQILRNLRRPGRWMESSDQEVQRAIARASQLFGRWLAREAENNGLPVVSTGPRETLIERLVYIICKPS